MCAAEYILLRRSEGASHGSITLEVAILKKAFNLAFRAAKVARVPYIPIPRSDNVRKGFIERDGYTRLRAALPEYLRPVVTMAYCTGMRRGEILSLRWESVDLLTRQVRLNAGETKNGEGRLIPLGDELLEALKSQLHLRNIMVPECQLVFFRIIKTKENPVPRWLPIGDFRKVWESACVQSGLTGLIFHDLRRSAIRNLVRAGVQEQVAMRISGHKTRSVFDRYAIVSEQQLFEGMRKLQKFQDAGLPAGQAPQPESALSAPLTLVN